MSETVDYQAPALRWYELMAVHDWQGLRALTHPDIDFIVAEGFPNGGHYLGADAVFDDYFPTASTAWERLVPVTDQVIPAGEHTIVLGRYVGVTRETQTPFDVAFAHVWRSDGAQLTELKQFIDTAIFRDRVAGIAA